MARRSRSIANLAVTLVARTTPFQKRLRAAKALAKRFGSSIVQAGKRLAQFSAVTVAAGAAIATAIIQRQRKAIDRIGKLSDQIGISTERLAGFRLAAKLSGVEANVLDDALQKMVKRVGAAARGGGAAITALKQMGLNISKLVALRPGDQFDVISRAINRAGDAGVQASLAFDIFGKQGINLLPLIRGGSAAVRQAQHDAEQFGLALSRRVVKQVENFNDNIERLKSLASGVARQFAVNVIPILNTFADDLVDMARDGRNVETTMLSVFENLALGAAEFGQKLTEIRNTLDLLDSLDPFERLRQYFSPFGEGPSASEAVQNLLDTGDPFRAAGDSSSVNRSLRRGAGRLDTFNASSIRAVFENLRNRSATTAAWQVAQANFQNATQAIAGVLERGWKKLLELLPNFKIGTSPLPVKDVTKKSSGAPANAIREALSITPLQYGLSEAKPLTVRDTGVRDEIREMNRLLRLYPNSSLAVLGV